MPGIVGEIGATIDSKGLLENMIASIKHEEWYKVDRYDAPSLGIARVHLGIFNPEPQPIFNDDKALCIFMDGKIYGYEEEMTKLKNKHETPIGNDPEFCLYSYEEYGIDFVKNLNGSFVFVICDLKENKIIIVNDRYGLRPVYYATNNGKLLFASEVKAILEDKTFIREINDETVADFFAFGEIIGNKTFFKGIEVLPPASIAVYDDQNLSIKQYWDFNYEPDYSKTEDEFVDELVKTFKKAVEIRMKDNHRYGVSLSGGLDSRSIVGAIDENKRKDILTFTFGPLDCDEVKIAKKVSDRAKTKFKAIKITPETIIDNAEKGLYLNDGHRYIGVSYYVSPIYRTISNDIDVAFNGFILDTVVVNPWLTEELINAKSEEELFDILLEKWRFLSDRGLSKLFVDEYYTKIKAYPLSSFKEAFNRAKASLPGNRSDLFELRNHTRRWSLMGVVLIRTTIEDSIPAFDNEFIDVAITIPPELRLNYYIYRKFLKKISPELAKIPNNHTMIRADAPFTLWKVGMMYLRIERKLKRLIWKISKGKIFMPSKRSYVEFEDWLRTNENWKRFFKDLLLAENAMSKTYFNQEYIKTLIREHEEGKTDNSLIILYLASFEIFLKLFMNKDR